VFRFDGRSWEKVAGEGIRGSWPQDGIPFVLGLTVFAGKLIAVLARPEGTPAAASSIWAFDGGEWRPVAAGHTPEHVAAATILNDVIEYRGRLVIATGASAQRVARAYSLEAGEQLCDISGLAFQPAPAAAQGGYWIYRLATDGVRLFAASAGHQGAAAVFEYSQRPAG
jgi:hypothetical protein